VVIDWEFDLEVVRPDENLAWLRGVANDDIVMVLAEDMNASLLCNALFRSTVSKGDNLLPLLGPTVAVSLIWYPRWKHRLVSSSMSGYLFIFVVVWVWSRFNQQMIFLLDWQLHKLNNGACGVDRT
jgi:hypothetical protein